MSENNILEQSERAARGCAPTGLFGSTELEALKKCDSILEAAQDYTRGATRVRTIRILIGKRIKDLESMPPNDKVSRPAAE